MAISCRTDAHRDGLAQLVPGRLTGHNLGWWLSNKDAVDGHIAWWTAGRSTDACVTELSAAWVPASAVSTAKMRASDPQFAAHRVFLDGDGRRIKGFPMIMHAYAPPVPAVAPLIGEHSGLILETMSGPLGHQGNEVYRVER